MYRVLVAGQSIAEGGGLEEALRGVSPETFEVHYIQNGDQAQQRAAELRPELIVLELDASGAGALTLLRGWEVQQPQAKLVAVLPPEGAAAAAETAAALGISGCLAAPVQPDTAAQLLAAIAASIREERQRRGEELRLAERAMEFMPLAEQEIVLSLMQPGEEAGESRAEEARLAPLFEGLGLTPGCGCGVVLAFPEPGGAPGLPAGMGALQLYEAVRSRAKAGGVTALVGPLVGRWIGVLRVGSCPPEEAAALEAAAEAWSQDLLRFVSEQIGAGCRLGRGPVLGGFAGLRQSLHAAAAAQAGAAVPGWHRHGEEIKLQIGSLQQERERRFGAGGADARLSGTPGLPGLEAAFAAGTAGAPDAPFQAFGR